MGVLRGALFGCGMISEYHLRGWQMIPEVEIVALGNRTIERAEERKVQFAPQARTYGDLVSLLEAERLDFIDILSPPDLHLEHCLIAEKAGVNIICQKPLCDNLRDARELVSRMNAYGKVFAVHENHRYRPWFQNIMAHAAAGFFGTPHFLRLEQHEPRAPAESYKSQMKQAILLEYGTHLVDMIRALLGEPESVYARIHRVNEQVTGESLVHAVYTYPQTTAVIDIAWKPGGTAQRSVLLTGDRGEAHLNGTMTRGESSQFRLIRGDEVIVDETRRPVDDYVESFYKFERECAEAMLYRRPVTQTGVENLKTLACTFAAYASAEQGAVIRLSDFYRQHDL